MYFLAWMGLIAVSLALSLAALAWALRTGQFADQGRARYLALGERRPPALEESARRPVEVYALAAIGAVVCLGLSAPLVLWLLGPAAR